MKSPHVSGAPIILLLLILGLAAVGCASMGGSAPPDAGEPAPQPGVLPMETQPALQPSPAPTEILPPVSQPTLPPPSPAPAILETRRLTLEYPSRMRAGVEADVVSLTLEVDDLGNITPTARIQGNTLTGETIQIPDLYQTHDVTAEARMDMAGMQVTPADFIYEPLKRGQSATFLWSISPPQTGIYRGTVWLHLTFTDRLSGQESRIPISAQIIEIKAVDLFGLPVNLVRTTGLIGSVVSGVIGFPFLEDILKFLLKRRHRKP